MVSRTGAMVIVSFMLFCPFSSSRRVQPLTDALFEVISPQPAQSPLSALLLAPDLQNGRKAESQARGPLPLTRCFCKVSRGTEVPIGIFPFAQQHVVDKTVAPDRLAVGALVSTARSTRIPCRPPP
jgi:hypothetical protein